MLRRLLRSILPLPLVLAACAAAPEPAEPDPAQAAPELRPVALRLALTGAADRVFPPGEPVPVELTYGEEAPTVNLSLTPGVASLHDLQPGGYAVGRIGPLACTGIGFAVGPGDTPAALGTLQAQILQTDYDVALVSASRATADELAALGGAEAVPLMVHRQALCHASRDGPGTEYRDLSPAEQVMAAILFAGLCAAAVASGGFCSF